MELNHLLWIAPGSSGKVMKSSLSNHKTSREASADSSTAHGDILPLPLHFLSAEEIRGVGDSPGISRFHVDEASQLSGDQPSLKWLRDNLKFIHAWVHNMIILLNNMNAGFHAKGRTHLSSDSAPNPSQMASLERLHWAAVRLLAGNCKPMPQISWKEEIARKRLTYDGEAIAKAVDLVVGQFFPRSHPRISRAASQLLT